MKYSLPKKALFAAPLVACALLLGACSSGDEDDGGATSTPPGQPPAGVPDSASASAAAMVAYLVTLTGDLPEDRDPLDISNFNPPTPEDTEPEPVS